MDRIEKHRRVSLALGIGVVVGMTIWTTVVLAFPHGGPAHAWLPSLARSLGVELFLVAGVARFVCWRTTRAAEDLRAAMALAAIGMTLPALAILTPARVEGAQLAFAAPLTRVIIFVPIVAVLYGTARSRIADRPARGLLVLGALVGPILTLAVLAELPRGPQVPMTVVTALSSVGELALAAAWVVLAVRAAGRRPGSVAWVPIAMLAMAACELVRAGTVTASGAVLEVAPAFGFAAGLLFACGAVLDARAALQDQGDQTKQISRALIDAQQNLARIEQVQRERLHDARSAIFGVIGASELLACTRTSAAVDRDSLQQMITAELTRLQTVLDTEFAEQIVDFELADVLGTVVLAHRIEYRKIHSTLDGLPVTGRPRATATVLDNLLRNARRHAPGATIVVRTEQRGDTMAVLVEDDGPGIDAAERSEVLRPGVRGSTAVGPGSGLGLHTCAQAMAGQSGGLRITARPGGGTCVTFTLPAAIDVRALSAMAS